MSKIRKYSVSYVRKNFSELINQVAYSGVIVIILKYGKAIAKIVPSEKIKRGGDEEWQK